MNDMINALLNHRTIREFDGQPVPEPTMQTLFDVGMRTTTSRGFQHSALIRVQDPQQKNSVMAISGQEYIARAPELIIGIVDARRSARILKEAGENPQQAAGMDIFREAFTDSVLMMQNMASAAECLGLGVTYLGSILNDVDRLIAVLELPKLTFPVLGMILGKPAQQPQLKPRMPKPLRVMTDRYTEPDSWTEALAGYDEEMKMYYDLRFTNQRSDSYTAQVVKKINDRPARNYWVQHIAKQGFVIDPDAGA